MLVVGQSPVAGDVARNEILFLRGEVGDGARGGGGGGPGPGGELVDKEVAGEDELFGGDLAGAVRCGVS